MPRITLLGKPGCHLCDDARIVVERVAADTGVEWEERSIVDDPFLMAQFGDLIPVTLIDGVKHAQWRVDKRALRAALAE